MSKYIFYWAKLIVTVMVITLDQDGMSTHSVEDSIQLHIYPCIYLLYVSPSFACYTFSLPSSALHSFLTHTLLPPPPPPLPSTPVYIIQEVGKREGDERGARPGPAGPRQHCPLLPLVGRAGA